MAVLKPMLLVPDLDTLADDDNNNEEGVDVQEEEEEQLLYRVPIFDPALFEFCSPPAFDETNAPIEEAKPATNQLLPTENQSHGFTVGFNPSDMELDEFAADVENLLGQGLDDDPFCIDGLGLLEATENNKGISQVKMELMDAIDTSDSVIGAGNSGNFLVDIDKDQFSRESLDFNFDCGSPTAEDEFEDPQKAEDRNGQMKKIGLMLDYEAVITEWSCRGCSPWTNGERPQFNLDDCWPDFMGTWAAGGELQGAQGFRGQVENGDGGREARVSRYREKRRTRLFSKKIRYEVRKLNAEKRPRMKGRFVKRASFPAAAPYV